MFTHCMVNLFFANSFFLFFDVNKAISKKANYIMFKCSILTARFGKQ